MWIYGIELWGTAKHTNINRIQILQYRIIKNIINFNVSKYTLYHNLNIPFVQKFTVDTNENFHNRLQPHSNPLVQNLSLPDLTESLKRHCGLATNSFESKKE